MPEKKEHIVPLYLRDRNLHGVMISPELWVAVEDDIWPILEKALLALGGEAPVSAQAEATPEPLEDWELLKEYWDFRYPYTAEVCCEVCGNTTEDWEKDDPRKFRLKAANLGGMAAFECQQCGARVVKRHFKDQIKCECKPCADKSKTC